MKIVPVEEIPLVENVQPTPTDNLMELYKVCQKMENLCQAENGIGLSAVQVGIPWKFFVVRNRDGSFERLVDCEYEAVGTEPLQDGLEGCLSLRNAEGRLRNFSVKRHPKVRVTGKKLLIDPDLSLEDVDLELDGLYSVVYQHEIDHHRGVLISEIGKEVEIW